MDLQIKDKVAIVTGSARGLGAATARRLAEEGAKVVITDILREQAESTAAALQADGLQARCIIADITKNDDVQRLVDDTIRAVLRDVLDLSQERVHAFDEATPLFGSLPELDSMAVAGVLTELEDRLAIVIEDDEVDGEMMASFGSLAHFARGKALL